MWMREVRAWKPSLVFVLVFDNDNDADCGRFEEIDGATLAKTTIVTGAALGYGFTRAIKSFFMYTITGNRIRFRISNDTPAPGYREYNVDGTGAWVDAGEYLAGIEDYRDAATYHAGEERIYYWFDDGGGNIFVSSHEDNDITPVNLLDIAPDGSATQIYYAGDGLVYFTVDKPGDATQKLYSVSGTAAPDELADDVLSDRSGAVYANTRLYMINSGASSNNVPTLVQWSDQVVPHGCGLTHSRHHQKASSDRF